MRFKVNCGKSHYRVISDGLLGDRRKCQLWRGGCLWGGRDVIMTNSCLGVQHVNCAVFMLSVSYNVNPITSKYNIYREKMTQKLE